MTLKHYLPLLTASAISNTKTPLIIIILTRSRPESLTLTMIPTIKAAATIAPLLSTKTRSKMTAMIPLSRTPSLMNFRFRVHPLYKKEPLPAPLRTREFPKSLPQSAQRSQAVIRKRDPRSLTLKITARHLVPAHLPQPHWLLSTPLRRRHHTLH